MNRYKVAKGGRGQGKVGGEKELRKRERHTEAGKACTCIPCRRLRESVCEYLGELREEEIDALCAECRRKGLQIRVDKP